METMIRLALSTLVLAAATAAPAAAAPQLVIDGGGFGHGVGMSQWGAQGQALQGRGYRAIVGSYFPGTKVSRARYATTLRVRLTTAPTASFSGATRAGTSTLNPRATYRARLYGARVELSGGGRRFTIPTSTAITGRGPLTVVGLGRYRGALELSAARDANDVEGELQVVNRVGVEDYLRGVVTQEAYGSWKPAALAAQAVVSRTYAVAVVKAGTVGYDQFADTRSQKYSGVAGESTTGDRAVRATRGQVVTYRGRAVPVFFHASSGGRTDSAEEGFGMTPQPWLVSVADPGDATPANDDHRWRQRMPLAKAERLLRRAGWLRGSLERIEPRGRKSSGRIVTATVVGSRGEAVVTGDDLAFLFGQKSSLATYAIRR